MKKSISILLVFMIFMSFSVSAHVLPFHIKLDGRYLEFPQSPIIENNRVLVPLRTIFEALGATLHWEDSIKTATAVRGDIVVKVDIINKSVTVNGVSVHCDVPPMIVNDFILVPVRVISQSFENLVDWDNETRTVIITSYDDVSIYVNRKLGGFWINKSYFDEVKAKRSLVKIPDYTLVNFQKNTVASANFHQSSSFVPLSPAYEITKDIYEVSLASSGGEQGLPSDCRFLVDDGQAETRVVMNRVEMVGFKNLKDLENHLTKLLFPNEFSDENGNRIRFNSIWLDTIDVPAEDCVDVTNMVSGVDVSYIFEFTGAGLNLYELAETNFGLYERGELKFTLTEVREQNNDI